MMNFNTPTPISQNGCATCRHIHKGPPIPSRYTDFPQIPYRCTLTNHKVNPSLRPCLLYEPVSPPVYPRPTRPQPDLTTS